MVASCSPFYNDPGNLVAGPILRKTPGEYGTSRSKSSVGPVNLRGNVLEAALGDLQKMATDTTR